MKRVLCLSILALAILLIPAAVYAAEASRAGQAVLVDGTGKEFEAYNIGGSNYFKLRDLAYALNGTQKQFDVGYDNATKAVTIKTGVSYLPLGGEMAPVAEGAAAVVSAEPSASRIFVDGKELNIVVYNIGGNNYFKLRDIARAVNCGVTFDEASGTVGIVSADSYSEPEAAYATVNQGAIISESPSIGGSTARLIYIPMGGNRRAEAVTSSGNVCSDRGAGELIKQANGKVVAAVNGGFFMSYYNAGGKIAFPDNYPEIFGALMRDGRVINGGGQNNAIGFDADGKPYIDRVDVKTNIVVQKDKLERFTVWGVNKYYEDNASVNMFTPEFTLSFTAKEDATVMTLKDGKVVTAAGGGSYTVPAGTNVAVFNAGAVANANQWNLFPKIGDSAYVETVVTANKGTDWSNVTTIIPGGRMMLQNGVNVTNDNAYNGSIDDPKQAASLKSQRSFVAVMGDGRLVLGTANASFDAIADYLLKNGAVDALSLDGGASSMLYTDAGGFITSAGRKLASALVIVEK